jgi:hypothetical protein
MALEILKTCIEQGCTKVLVDVRKLEGWLSTLESYTVASKELEQLRWKGLSKAAIVDRPRDTGPFPFFETVARNRGLNLMMFREVDKAIEWLRGEQVVKGE